MYAHTTERASLFIIYNRHSSLVTMEVTFMEKRLHLYVVIPICSKILLTQMTRIKVTELKMNYVCKKECKQVL